MQVLAQQAAPVLCASASERPSGRSPRRWGQPVLVRCAAAISADGPCSTSVRDHFPGWPLWAMRAQLPN